MLPPAAWKLCESFLVHGLTVAAVLNIHEWMHLPRDLDCVEIFAGVGSIAAAAAEKGLHAAAYDKGRIPGVTENRGHPNLARIEGSHCPGDAVSFAWPSVAGPRLFIVGFPELRSLPAL